MAWHSIALLAATPLHSGFYCFLFFSTLTSYSFHWYFTTAEAPFTGRMLWLRQHQKVHLALFCLSLVATIYFFTFLLASWFWLIPAAVMTFLYSAPKIPLPAFKELRKIAIGKTAFLAFIWTYATTALPLVIAQQPFTATIWFFICSRFCLLYAICILFDYRDRNYDMENGIRSLITWLSPRKVFQLFRLSLILCLLFTGLMFFNGFSLISFIILIAPVFITAALKNRSIRQPTDPLYYFVLDGVMAFSAVLYAIYSLF